MEALATKYRPTDWSSVTEQESIKIILQQQLDTNTVKNAYLFCGGAGTGKTTCARIFANEINKGKGLPIEMDAASNSGVEDVRNITQQAKLKSMDSAYKIFIIDECHAISNTGWQAFLKLIEEPPKNTIFIFCTTDPQKIPKTILSRVQRYDFKRISEQGIVNRLTEIIVRENSRDYNDPDLRDIGDIRHDAEAIEYIAKIADGGMRDAITMMDKCLSYSTELTLENVVKALGTVDYEIMKELTDAMMGNYTQDAIDIIERVHADGKDIKQFVALYIQFLIDIQKYDLTKDFRYTQIPGTEVNKEWLDSVVADENFDLCYTLLGRMLKLNSRIKWSQTPKYDVEGEILMLGLEGTE